MYLKRESGEPMKKENLTNQQTNLLFRVMRRINIINSASAEGTFMPLRVVVEERTISSTGRW
jgi:hypothetical protein